jgi:predicted HAD superfamily phosphohydrolase YqeG
MTQTAQDAIRKLTSLKQVTVETGVITNRAQREILKALSAEDLAEVAQACYPAVDGFKKAMTEVAK